MTSPFFEWAWRQANLLPSHRVVLMLLAEFAQPDGRVTLVAGEIKRRIRIDRNTAQRAIDYLAAQGLVEVVQAGKGRAPRIYRLRGPE